MRTPHEVVLLSHTPFGIVLAQRHENAAHVCVRRVFLTVQIETKMIVFACEFSHKDSSDHIQTKYQQRGYRIPRPGRRAPPDGSSGVRAAQGKRGPARQAKRHTSYDRQYRRTPCTHPPEQQATTLRLELGRDNIERHVLKRLRPWVQNRQQPVGSHRVLLPHVEERRALRGDRLAEEKDLRAHIETPKEAAALRPLEKEQHNRLPRVVLPLRHNPLHSVAHDSVAGRRLGRRRAPATMPAVSATADAACVQAAAQSMAKLRSSGRRATHARMLQQHGVRLFALSVTRARIVECREPDELRVLSPEDASLRVCRQRSGGSRTTKPPEEPAADAEAATA